jgi:hypothetical protein
MSWEATAISLGKWALGAVGGGLIFKTIVDQYQEWRRRKRMRRQLYEEILLNYQSFLVQNLIATLEGIKQETPFRFKEKLTLFLSAWKNYSSDANKSLLFTLDEAGTIQHILESFESVNVLPEDNPCELLRTAREAIAEVDEAIVENKLDGNLLIELASPNIRTFISDLIEGKRKSYKASLNPF